MKMRGMMLAAAAMAAGLVMVGCGTCGAADKPMLCGGCGQMKGGAACCKAGTEKCGSCKLDKGSPGCCKMKAGTDAEMCGGCNKIKGSEDCAKACAKGK